MKESSSLPLSLSNCLCLSLCLCTPWSLPAMLATPTALHCRVVDIFKQQRQVPCSERAQQLLTGSGQAHAAYTLCAALLLLVRVWVCGCVCANCQLVAT